MSRIPAPYSDADDSLFEFNKMVIDATRDHCVAYKPNTAFFEAHGASGWLSLEKTIRYIGSSHFVIADAKRGDIGNTSKMYAKTFFETYNFDAVTIAFSSSCSFVLFEFLKTFFPPNFFLIFSSFLPISFWVFSRSSPTTSR